MISSKPTILSKNGENEFVVLAYEDYLSLQERLEDYEDLIDLLKAKKEEGDVEAMPWDEFKRQLNEDPA